MGTSWYKEEMDGIPFRRQTELDEGTLTRGGHITFKTLPFLLGIVPYFTGGNTKGSWGTDDRGTLGDGQTSLTDKHTDGEEDTTRRDPVLDPVGDEVLVTNSESSMYNNHRSCLQ